MINSTPPDSAAQPPSGAADPPAPDGSETPAGVGDAPLPEHADAVTDEPGDAADPSYRQAPTGFTVRRPQDADLAAISRLYERAAPRAEDGTLGRGALRTATDLRRTWEERRNDALVVLRDGDVVGYLEFHEQLDPWTPVLESYAEGRVDPAASGRGLGEFLLDRAVDRARKTAEHNPDVPVVLRTTLVDPVSATLRWLASRGLVPERHMLQLRIDLGDELPRPEWPDGTSGVRADMVDVAALHDALVRSFRDHHLGATDDLDTWRSLALDRGRLQLWASVAAVDDEGTPVGLALGRVGGEDDPGLGVIAELGVVPAWRGRGLATAVLRAAFARFAQLGVQRVGLEVDDVTLDGALRLYERAGMEVVHHTVVLATEIAHPPE